MLNLFNSLFGRYNENIKANVEIYLKCRLEGTLGFTSEMKGSVNIKQHFDKLSVHTSTHFDTFWQAQCKGSVTRSTAKNKCLISRAKSRITSEIVNFILDAYFEVRLLIFGVMSIGSLFSFKGLDILTKNSYYVSIADRVINRSKNPCSLITTTSAPWQSKI